MFDLLDYRKFTLTHYVFPNIACIFIAKPFSLGNLSFLTHFQVSNSNSVSFTIKITCTCCRDGQLIWLEGHFE